MTLSFDLFSKIFFGIYAIKPNNRYTYWVNRFSARLVVDVNLDIDISLVKSAKMGDQRSFAQLYDSISMQMYKYALYSLGNPHDAEDVVSETFLDAFRGLHTLRDESAFKSWIMKILSIKIKHKFKEYSQSREVVELPDDAGGSEDISTQLTDKSAAMEALNKLTPQERQIVVLTSIYGYTTREVAAMLGCPHGTVSSKLHRSLAKLRSILQ